MSKALRLYCPICKNEVASGPAAEIEELTS